MTDPTQIEDPAAADATVPPEPTDGAEPNGRGGRLAGNTWAFTAPAPANPFDAFDQDMVGSGTLQPGPRPGMGERLRLNAKEGFANSIFGAAIDYAAPGEPSTRARAKAAYDALPQWQTPLEGAVALGGQLAGGLPSIENMVPVAVGERLVTMAGLKLTGLGARVLAGATDAAIVNAATDPAVQGIQIAAGNRDAYDPLQTATAAGLGFGIGGVLGGLLRKKPEISSTTNEAAKVSPAEAAPAGGAAKAGDAATPGEARQPTAAATPAEPGTAPDSAKAAGEPPKAADTPPSAPPPAPEPKIPEPTPERPDGIRAAAEDAVGPDATLGDRLAAEAAIREGRPIPGAEKPSPQDASAPPEVAKPKRTVTREAMSLVEFIAANGGIKDDAGELAARDASKLFVPGFGRIVRDKGLPLDKMRERAAEAGYFDTRFGSSEEAMALSTPADLLGALDADVAAMASKDRTARVYSSADADYVAKLHDQVARAEDKRALDEFRQRVADEGLDTTDRTLIERAFGHYAEVGDIGTALERAAFELEDQPVYGREAKKAFDIPGWETSNAHTGPTQSGSGEVPRGGNAGDRPGGAAGASDLRPPPGDAGATGLTTERTAAGAQGLIPGVAPVTDRARAESAAAKPLRGGDAAPPAGGLFDQNARDQRDLFMRSGPMTGETKRAAGGLAETSPDTQPAFVRLKDVADKLAEALDPAAIRQGRIAQKAEGIYKTGPGVVRVRNTQDFSVLTHELGHHLEVKVGKPIQTWMTANKARLEPLAYAGAAKGVELKEGFAEMARLFVTNPAYLDQRAPGLAADFETALKASAPDLLAALGDARTAYAEYLAQPSARAVASTIVSAKRPGWAEKARDALGDVKGTIAEFFSSAYTKLMDDLHPLSRTVDELARIHNANKGKVLDLKAVDDPYKLARMARGAYSSGHGDIVFGVTPYHGTAPVSGSLRDALIEAQGGGNVFSRVDEAVMADFGSYLWSRRALGEWERFGRGEIPNPPDKLTRGDHEVNVREMEAKNPAFVTAAEKVYDWNRALWEKKFDAGLLSREQYDEGLKIVDYVPGFRHFDPAEAKVGSREGGKSGKGSIVKHFQGSDRDVINPIDSLVADAYETSMAIARNDTIRALAALGDLAGKGSGRLVERIPTTELKAHGFETDQVIDTIGRELGLRGPDLAAVKAAATELLPDKLTFFKPAMVTEKGEAIVWFRDGGELVPLRLADGKFGAEMVGALNVMTRDEKAFLLELLSKPAALLRLGVTTHPTFLVANFVRDQMVTTILFGKPVERLGLSLKGFADDLFGREAAQSYIRAGGITGGANTATLAEARIGRDTTAATMSGVGYRLTTFKGLIEATESAETASRLGNFGVFFKAAKERGLDDWEASFEAAYRARDVLDFDRRGSGTMAISRIIPFLNASVQGIDKAAREMLTPIAKHLAGDTLTTEEQRTLANSGGAWMRASIATIGTMALWAIVSRNPAADEIDPRIRATHWVVPTGDGRWYTIPKPFELAAILNIGEFAWDAMVKADPKAAERYLSGLFDVLAPPSLLEGNPLLKSAYEFKANMDFFTGRPIVSDQMKALEPWLQYDHRTSTLAKRLGEAANVSPLKIDHLITGFFGSWGRSVLSLSDWASGEKPSAGWAEAIFTRRFIKDASRGSTSVGAFWDLVSQRTGTLEGALKTYRALNDEGRTADASAWLGRQDADVRAYLAASLAHGQRGQPVSSLHPLVRARSAVTAIGGLMRDLADDTVTLADGKVSVNATDRRRALDVLSDLKMAEARNALIQVGAKGFSTVRAPIDTDTYIGELAAISPDVAQALADRYRTVKVLKKAAVDAAWPELRTRLLRDGSDATTADLAAMAHAQGYELDGRRIKPKGKPSMPGVNP